MDLTKDIIQATQNVREKYLALKSGKANLRKSLNEVFEPVTNPMKKVLGKPTSSTAAAPPTPVFQKTLRIPQAPKKKKTPRFTPTVLFSVNSEYLPYISLIRGTRADPRYGVQVNKRTGRYILGKTPVIFRENEIKIGDKSYVASPGLYELLIKTVPEGYTKEELLTYLEILDRTNAHREGNTPTGRIIENGGVKFNTIIRPYFVKDREEENFDNPKEQEVEEEEESEDEEFEDSRSELDVTSGEGYFKDYKKYTDYKYFNSADELVDRLRLLWASQQAGHTDHDNEIKEIITELKKLGLL